MRWLALVIIFATATARAGETPVDAAVRTVNAYRAAAGLPSVALDKKLYKGCMEHAEYLRKNFGSPAIAGLAAHNQDPRLPGATAAGAACGKAADLFVGTSSLTAAVHAWVGGIYHRRPILDPTLERLGIGHAILPDGSIVAVLMFVNAKDPKQPKWPVAYPGAGEQNVPLEYALEIPNPVPGGGHAGYAVTLQFPPFDKVTNVKATLTTKAGKAVPFYFSDPEHPATSFPQSGMISLIPKQLLDAATAYHVKIEATWRGKRSTWAWSFSTLQLRTMDAQDIKALTNALGEPSLVRGKVTHGGMVDAATVFLALADNGKLVSVIMPLAVWKQLARNAKPGAFKGRALEVQATPRLVGDKFINLSIGSARQFRFVSTT